MIVACRPVVSLFAEPSLTCEVTSQVIYGSAVEVLADLGAWWRVGTADGYEGFAQAEDFVVWNPAPSSLIAEVGQLSANLYRSADVKACAPLLNVPWEARLEILDWAGGQDASGEHARWLPVRLLDGSTAQVQRGDLCLEKQPASLEEMLALAHRFLGITYTWGGTSTYGFDCSGFVQMLFRQAGFGLPRDAQAQADWAGFAPVPLEGLMPADAVFFGDSPREITHVGLYLGQGLFIHDTTEAHPCIQISHLSDQPWAERLTAQRRLTR